MQDGDVILAENTRYHAGEEKNDPAFTKALAALATSTSTTRSRPRIARTRRPKDCASASSAAGRAMQAELSHLRSARNPERPVMAVVGGAKISTKIAARKLVGKVDTLVIGGAMANTFLAAEGHQIGKSFRRPINATRRAIMASARQGHRAAPRDVVVAREFKANALEQIVRTRRRDEEMILDVGPRTIQDFGQRSEKPKTVVWNGPFGAFEMPPFDAEPWPPPRPSPNDTRGKLLSVAGGGDTVAALAHAGVMDAFQLRLDRGRRVS
jgi:phosphoglycerate kinase